MEQAREMRAARAKYDQEQAWAAHRIQVVEAKARDVIELGSTEHNKATDGDVVLERYRTPLRRVAAAIASPVGFALEFLTGARGRLPVNLDPDGIDAVLQTRADGEIEHFEAFDVRNSLFQRKERRFEISKRSDGATDYRFEKSHQRRLFGGIRYDLTTVRKAPNGTLSIIADNAGRLG